MDISPIPPSISIRTTGIRHHNVQVVFVCSEKGSYFHFCLYLLIDDLSCLSHDLFQVSSVPVCHLKNSGKAFYIVQVTSQGKI